MKENKKRQEPIIKLLLYQIGFQKLIAKPCLLT